MRTLLAALFALLLVPAPASAKALITYDRQGGIAGTPLTISVSTTGQTQTTTDRSGGVHSFKLSDKRFAALRQSIRRAHFATLKGRYVPKPGVVADGYIETVTYHGKSVVAGTGGKVPPRLQQLLSRLSSLG